MHSQSLPVPSITLAPKTAESLPSAPLNSFQKLKTILNATRSKKIKEKLQRKQAAHIADTKNNSDNPQLIADDPNVEHSRSRDKPKNNKAKKTKKQPKKSKQTLNEAAESVTQTSQLDKTSGLADTADKVHPLIHDPLQTDASQLPVTHQGGIVVTEDICGLLSNVRQYECGQIVEDLTSNKEVVDIKQPVVAINASQKPVWSAETNLSLMRQPVYQGWEDINQQCEKDKTTPQENRLLQHRKYQEENQEEQKYKPINNYAYSDSDFNDRLERKNFSSVDEKDWCYKSKICYEFLKGRCRKNAHQCTYAHGYEDLKHDRRSRFVCRNYSRGFCKKIQDECKFYHERPRERQDSPISEISSSSDFQRKRQRRVENTGSKKQEKAEKRDSLKQWRREERMQQVRAEVREETKDLKDTRLEERKNVRWSAQQKKIENMQRIEENCQDKKNKETNDLPKAENYETNHQPYLPFGSGYLPFGSGYLPFGSGYLPANCSHPTKNLNIPEQISNIPPTIPMGYGFSSFPAPIYFPSFYPIPYHIPYYQHASSNTPYNKQKNVHPIQQKNNLPPTHFAMPNYVAPLTHCYPPAANHFYPWHLHPCLNSHPQQNLSNQTLEPANSENEQHVNTSGDQKRQKERYSRERKRTSSKQKSRERKEKKYRR